MVVTLVVHSRFHRGNELYNGYSRSVIRILSFQLCNHQCPFIHHYHSQHYARIPTVYHSSLTTNPSQANSISPPSSKKARLSNRKKVCAHAIQSQQTPQSTRSIIHPNSTSPSSSILHSTMPGSTSSGVEIPPSFKFYGPTMPRSGQP